MLLCAELDTTRADMALLHEELNATRRKLSSADADFFRLHDLNNDIDRDTDDAIRDLKEQIRDLEWGNAPRRRKVPHHHSCSQSPSASRSRQTSRTASPMLEDREDSPAPSSAALPYLLGRMDLPAAAPPNQSPANPPPAGGNLASRLTDAVSLEPPAPAPTLAATQLAATPFYAAVDFPSLHPIVSFSGNQYHCTMRDAAGNIDVDADTHFIYATGRLSEDGPASVTSLVTRDYLEEESTINAMAAALPLPIWNIVWGGGGMAS